MKILRKISVIICVMVFSAIFTTNVNAEENITPSDPNLEQNVQSNEQVVSDIKEIREGHIDIGPRLIDGKLQLLLRDDSNVPSVWRNFNKTVLRLDENSMMNRPTKEEFSFIKEDTNGKIYVSPQTQKQSVAWVGWNTQSPEIVENVSKGATLRLLNVQGPGQVTMFLESGVFGPPTILWDSLKKQGQDIWMDLNTHTHANWVFTKPGAYLINVELRLQLNDGTVKKVLETLRFAVGKNTTAEQVLNMKAKPELKNIETANTQNSQNNTDENMQNESISEILPIVAIGAAVVAIGLIFLILITLKNRKNKKNALKEMENMNLESLGK